MARWEDERAPNLLDYLHTVRRGWWKLALATLIAVGAAAAYTYTQPNVYRSSMKIVVGQGQGIFAPEVGNVAEQFTQTMSDLLESDVVAAEVIDRLELELSPAELLSNANVVTKPATAVLEVTYDDSNRARGRAILETIGEVFTGLVREKLVPEPGTAALPDDATNLAVTATIFDPAHYLPGQVAPKPLRNIAVAGVLGLVLGLLALVVGEQFNDTIKTLDEAELAFGQTATATLPPRFIGYRPLDPDAAPNRRFDPVLAELALQRLSASLVWNWGPRDPRTFVVTSANPEEGKTTIASNFAVALALEGYDVIAVEADLRRPMLAKFLDAADAPTASLGGLARREVDVEAVLHEIPLPRRRSTAAARDQQGRLRVYPSLPGEQWPRELDLDRANELMEELRGRADYVVFDTPPILVVTDAYPLVAGADAVVATVRNGKSTLAATEALSKTLARLRLRKARRGEMVVTEVEPSFGAGHYRYEATPASAPSPASRPAEPAEAGPSSAAAMPAEGR
ncbi:MAG: Wzz/FepE/Etk N-terminal domain-containing protein [Actinomycetota bacterium]|nr:Wzz/FepE/Etk N-terminal domain-containing protein [Actinomycetota bacterium]